MISSLYNTILYQPLFNALVAIYNIVPGGDFGIAIIILTLLFRFALYPLSAKAIIAQRKLAKVQPKVKELQEKFKQDKDKQAREMMSLYKKEGVNPFAGILPILIQLPILIALYQVFWKGLDVEQLQHLYSFVANPSQIEPLFLGMINLAEKSFIVAGLAGAFQFLQGKQLANQSTKQSSGKPDFAATLQKRMLYFFPVLTLLIVSQLPSAVGLYWITTSIFSIGQQWYVTKNLKEQSPNDIQHEPRDTSNN